MSLRKTGDWALARRLLAETPRRLADGVETGLRREAEALRKEIVQGITRQAPGGEALKQPSPLTLAARKMKGFGGTKALLVRGDLRNAISTVIRRGEAFVGVPRKARGKDGEPLVDVAQTQESGSDPIVIPMTPAMRRFLFALLRRAGEPPRGGSGKGVVVVSVPPRPFLRPAFKAWSKGAQRRFLTHVARKLGLGGV